MIDRWRPPRKDERELAWVAFGVAVAGIALSPLAAVVAGLLPPCLFRQWVGVPCPSCGATRAILALGRLDVAAAVAVNPLACAALVSLIAAGLVAPWWLRFGGSLPVFTTAARRALLWGALAAAAVNWLYLAWSGI